jgi:hypothetical protein
MNSEVLLSVPGFRQRAITRKGVLQWIALSIFLGVLTPASQASFIWESNVGSPLLTSAFAPTSSDGIQPKSLNPPYTFPFEGTPYTSINIYTSGFIYLGTDSSLGQCCVLGAPSTAMTLFEQGPARVAPGWATLRPDLGGEVDFNQITDAGGSRTVITYSNVPTDPSNLSKRVTFQVQLFSTGEMAFSYQQFDWNSLGLSQGTVLGLTPAGAGMTTQTVDFTALTPGVPTFFSGQSLYDYLTNIGSPGCKSGPSCLSLSGESFDFVPSANGSGWTVTAALAPAVPEPSTFIPGFGAILLFSFVRFRQKRITK